MAAAWVWPGPMGNVPGFSTWMQRVPGEETAPGGSTTPVRPSFSVKSAGLTLEPVGATESHQGSRIDVTNGDGKADNPVILAGAGADPAEFSMTPAPPCFT